MAITYMNRSPKRGDSGSIAKGMYWGSQASSAAMQFAIPPAIGYWVDLRYGTKPIGVIVGAILGFYNGLTSLFRLVKLMERNDHSNNRDRTHSDDHSKPAK